ncbi:MAG: hypothetical protein ACLQUT_04280, partial [Thermoleophilia bacterium]
MAGEAKEGLTVLADGVRRWTARHPEWHPRVEWGHEVASYAIVSGDVLSLVDPLLPDDQSGRRAGVLAALDALAGAARHLEILITIPYHVRSAEDLYVRYADRLDTTLWGHVAVGRRLAATTPLSLIEPGRPAGAVARALAIGKPRRNETPLYFADQRALAFGDALIVSEGALRVWLQAVPRRANWYRDSFVPSLAALLDLELDLVLVTHGEAVVAA